MRLDPRAFLAVSGCSVAAWAAAEAGRAGAAVAELGVTILNVLAAIAGVWIGSMLVGRSQTGVWGIDRAPGWQYVAVVALAGGVAEAGDALLAALGMPVEMDAGPWGRELVQAMVFASVLWGAYLLVARTLGVAVAPPQLAATAGLPEQQTLDPPPEARGDEAASFMASGLLRLVRNPRVRASLEVIKAEGNYVDVLGADGHELILYRFSQAVEEMSVTGMQVHRSYWVRRSAVRDMQRSGKTGRLMLASGREVPVSAPYLAAAQSLLPQPTRTAGRSGA